MFSSDDCKCPSCGANADTNLVLDMIEGAMYCNECEEHFNADTLREHANRMSMMADFLDGASKLAETLQKTAVGE